VIADQFHVPLYTVTWVARVLVIAGPVAAYVIARRICLGLQRKDAETLAHGVETGIIRQSPDGELTEVLRPLSDEERAVVSARPAPRALPGADADGISASAGVGVMGKLRIAANAVFTETVAVAAEANGHATDGEHHPADGQGELPASEPHREASPGLGRST
jgi:ubiquinol-cytochrome c reductase cytochrome b subunit